MNFVGGARPVNYVEAVGIRISKLTEALGYSSMVFRAAPSDRITDPTIALSEPLGQAMLINFEQDRAIRPQSVASELVQALNGFVAQPPCPALIGTARINEAIGDDPGALGKSGPDQPSNVICACGCE